MFDVTSTKPETFVRLDAGDAATPVPASEAGGFHLIDTTMMYAPRSGGVKRYLMAKRAWLEARRPDIRHTLVVPGARTRADNRFLASRILRRMLVSAGAGGEVILVGIAHMKEKVSISQIAAVTSGTEERHRVRKVRRVERHPFVALHYALIRERSRPIVEVAGVGLPPRHARCKHQANDQTAAQRAQYCISSHTFIL